MKILCTVPPGYGSPCPPVSRPIDLWPLEPEGSWWLVSETQQICTMINPNWKGEEDDSTTRTIRR